MKKDKESQALRKNGSPLMKQMIQVYAVHTDMVHCSILVKEGIPPEGVAIILGMLSDAIEMTRNLYTETIPRAVDRPLKIKGLGVVSTTLDEIERKRVEELAESTGLDLPTVQSIRKGIREKVGPEEVARRHGVERLQVYDVAEDLLKDLVMVDPLDGIEPQTIEEAGEDPDQPHKYVGDSYTCGLCHKGEVADMHKVERAAPIEPHAFESFDKGPGSGRCGVCQLSIDDPVHKLKKPKPPLPIGSHAFDGDPVDGFKNLCDICGKPQLSTIHGT